MRVGWCVMVIGCARVAAPPAAPVSGPPDATTPAARPEDVDALRGRADAAVIELATRLDAIQASCRERWLEPEAVCEASGLAPLARDYQAYYGQREDPRHDSGRIDALPRLGGPRATAEDVTIRMVTHCEDRCRTARFVAIDVVATAAADQCVKESGSVAPCKAFAQKLAPTVRASEVERWTGVCEGRCDNERTRARIHAEIERRRPRTQAQADACARTCNAKFKGEWCGTPLMTCLSQCSLRPK
jgi:hypothetical protein